MPALLLTLMALFAPNVPIDTLVVTEAHYRVYDGEGHPASIEAIVDMLGGVDALLVGETHDDPVAHHLQRVLLERAFISQHERGVALSMEMFSRDVQYILDEYLAGMITESHFTGSTNPWMNYATDYRPLVEFAAVHGMAVVAANAPRRYVNRVTRMGPQSLVDLSDGARSHLAPLPYAGPSDAYKAEWDAVMAEAMEQMRAAADSAAKNPGMPALEEQPESEQTEDVPDGEEDRFHQQDDDAEGEESAPPAGMGGGMHGGMSYMLASQSLWDATMAHSVARHLQDRPGSLVVHVVGAFHVENATGIPEHLARYRPAARQLIVTVRPAEDIESFVMEEHGGLGDFVILADEGLPRTHIR